MDKGTISNVAKGGGSSNSAGSGINKHIPEPKR